MVEPVYEMLWDCRFCGAKKLLGLTHRHCPNCGAEQDANARYFPPDAERVAVQNHVYVGADIVCHYCGNASSRAAHNCGTCGAPLGEGQGVAQRADQVHGAGAAFAGQSVADAQRERERGAAALPVPKKRSVLVWLVPLSIVLFAIFGGIASLFLWKKQSVFTVSGVTWKRTIVVESYGPVNDSAWCDKLPAGALVQRHHREQRSTKQVPDGEDCQVRKVDKGDGTFHEKRECTPKYKEEPVEDDKCDYRIDRWHSERTEAVSGIDAGNVRWPPTKLLRTGSCMGCEREGAHNESYSVAFQDAKAESYACDFPQAKWTTFSVGSQWTGEIRRLVGTLDCDSLTKH